MTVQPRWPGSCDEPAPRPGGAQVSDVIGQLASARPGEGQVHPSVLRMRAVGTNRSTEDAELIAATAGVVVAARDAVLGRRGLTGDELGKTQSASVEQEVRNLAAAELQLAIGLGVTEARVMVTAAMSPDELVAVIDRALRAGQASWPLVRAFFEKAIRLSAEQRMLVALALFGGDAALAHEDRLDPDGDLRDEPWGHARFTAALDGEVTACESTDPDAERTRRARAYARRRLSVKVHDDGTATLRITGPAATMVAVHQRYDRAARNLRKAGDERTLDQLRADTADAVLLYGTLTLPGAQGGHVKPAPVLNAHDADDLAEADDAEDAEDVGHGPAGEGTISPDGRAEDGSVEDGHAEDRRAEDGRAGRASGSGDGLFDETLAPDDMEHIARVVNALPLVQLQVVVPYGALSGGFPICVSCSNPTDRGRPAQHDPDPDADPGEREDSAHEERPGRPPDATRRRGRGPVGEVLGPHPFFITDGHARELALLPGTTLHRLVVDPRDGRLVERTIKAYRPDTDMRRQVIAADVYSRAPGSRLGAHAGELDHVRPYGWAGGPTSETNLALLAKRPHQFKTDGAWRVLINDRRDLTITSVLGQVTTTRVHDYRTYLRTRHPDDLDARRDLANRLVHAALAQQPRHRGIAHPFDGLSMDWTDSNGATHRGPSPDHPTLDHLLADADADVAADTDADTQTEP